MDNKGNGKFIFLILVLGIFYVWSFYSMESRFNRLMEQSRERKPIAMGTIERQTPKNELIQPRVIVQKKPFMVKSRLVFSKKAAVRHRKHRAKRGIKPSRVHRAKTIPIQPVSQSLVGPILQENMDDVAIFATLEDELSKEENDFVEASLNP